jgi:hypothetical protein
MEQSDLPVTISAGRGSLLEDSVETPLLLESGDYLELEDGSQLLLDTGMTVSRGYETYADAIYTSDTISFTAGAGILPGGGFAVPAKLHDSQLRFADQHIQSNMSIQVSTTSGTNDGNYTIADRGVSRGELSLASSYDLATEDAATAGTVIIKRIIFQPNVITGCPFCGSLNSR